MKKRLFEVENLYISSEVTKLNQVYVKYKRENKKMLILVSFILESMLK